VTVPKYKFSLEALVTDAVDDKEVEASVAKVKLAIQSSEWSSVNPKYRDTKANKCGLAMRDDLLASVMDDSTDAVTFQRLKDAVDRTEALDQAKRWSFFDDQISMKAAPKFPQTLTCSGIWEAVFRGEC
jgi:hypothetical protein